MFWLSVTAVVYPRWYLLSVALTRPVCWASYSATAAATYMQYAVRRDLVTSRKKFPRTLPQASSQLSHASVFLCMCYIRAEKIIETKAVGSCFVETHLSNTYIALLLIILRYSSNINSKATPKKGSLCLLLCLLLSINRGLSK